MSNEEEKKRKEDVEVVPVKKSVDENKKEDASHHHPASPPSSSHTSFSLSKSVMKWTVSQPSIPYSPHPRMLLMDPANDKSVKQDAKEDEEKKVKTESSSSRNKDDNKSKRGSDLSKESKGKSESDKNKKLSIDDKRQDTVDKNKHHPPSSSVTPDSRKTEKHDTSRHDSSSQNESKKASSTSSSHHKKKKLSQEELEEQKMIEQKKQELLEKVRKRREEEAKEGKSTASSSPPVKEASVKILNPKLFVGKISRGSQRKPKDKSDDRGSLDMNRDYSQYQHHYTHYYSLDPYTAAYYAQYAMITSGEYSHPDLSSWLSSHGLSYDISNSAHMSLVPTAETTSSWPVTEVNGEGLAIPVLTPVVSEAAKEQFFDNVCDDAQSEEMDVESDGEKDVTDESVVVPPPPPSPPRITTLIVEQPFCLPNGQEVPAGTKQIIVHPYPDRHPLSAEFSPEALQSAVIAFKAKQEEGGVTEGGKKEELDIIIKTPKTNGTPLYAGPLS